MFKPVKKIQKKAKIALYGVSGSGKTYGALQIAKGMGGRIALADSEAGNSSLYRDLCDFDLVILQNTDTETYIQIIDEAVKQKYNVLIIDSISHEWINCNDRASSLTNKSYKKTGKYNGFIGWGIVKPIHNKLIEKIINSDINIIITLRGKTKSIIDGDGNYIRKIARKPIQSASFDYEFDIFLRIDQDHKAHQTKQSKIYIVQDNNNFLITQEYGLLIKEWYESHKDGKKIDDFVLKFKKDTSIFELKEEIDKLLQTEGYQAVEKRIDNLSINEKQILTKNQRTIQQMKTYYKEKAQSKDIIDSGKKNIN